MFDLRLVASRFDMPGSFISAHATGTGHINDTFAVTVEFQGKMASFILQRINHNVFKDPVSLMSNVVRVTNHQRVKLHEAGAPDADRRALMLVQTKEGAPFHKDEGGNTWRVYHQIRNARTYDVLQSPAQAYQAGRAFGIFQQQLVDLPGGRLFETIPDFHNTPRRFEKLETALQEDVMNRAAGVRDLIAFAMERKDFAGILIREQAKGNMPERITHNDTKINNVMLDDQTGEGVCVIDLDTVMPGLTLYDFGDLVRSSTNSADESEKDTAKIRMRMEIFEAVAKGYIETAGSFLTGTEKKYLSICGRLITFEVGIRFLTDYLAGDVYFKTRYPGQNVDRCMGQFKMVLSMEQQEQAMQKAIDRCFAGTAAVA